ncbi:MAG: VWA domain-containing protein [Saprospiraceae bacterium]|nr:VWA domain-containing protein [Saprospiraceae bacterium]
MDNRWQLVLGVDKDNTPMELSTEEREVEELLSKIYGQGNQSGFGRSSQKIRKWLEGIRIHFPPETVSIMQKDALERQGIKEMLLEPELLEKIEPNIQMVASILSLQQLLPDKTRIVARQLVDRLVKRIQEKLNTKITQAVRTSIKGKSQRIYPKGNSIDWKRTLQENLKYYEKNINSIIPRNWFGYKSGSKLKEVYLLIDKSESMITSAIHASVIGSVLASLSSIRTHLIFFDTEVTDLTDKYQDPVDILFSVPMGGGTDIANALKYTEQKMRNHSHCLLFLISDLDEGGSKEGLLSAILRLQSKKCSIHCLLSLNDEGKPEYNRSIAEDISSFKIPVYGADPENFPDILSQELRLLSL